MIYQRSFLSPGCSRNAARRALRWSVYCLLTVTLAGCSSAVDESLVQSGETGLQSAIQLVDAKQCSQALPILDKCINEGGLNADLLSMALVQRARCHIEAGNTDAATLDLERAEQGSAPMDQFHMVKGLLLRKLGKTQEANAEFAKARKLSPKLKIPS